MMNDQHSNFTLKELVNAAVREYEGETDSNLSVTIIDEDAFLQELPEIVTKAQFDEEMPVADLVDDLDSIEVGDEDVF